MVKKTYCLLVFVFSMLFAQATTDTTLLKAGDVFPDITFEQVRNYKKKSFTLREFQPKWTVVEFWSMGCMSAITIFPKLFELQREFRKDIQFITVGKMDNRRNSENEKVFDRMVAHYKAPVIGVFDSTLFDRFGVHTVPHVYIIDPGGTVRFVTYGSALTHENLRKLISGTVVSLPEKREAIKREMPGILGWALGNKEVISTSTLTEWNGESDYSDNDLIDFTSLPEAYLEQGLQYIQVDIPTLYANAYFGRTFLWSRDTVFYGKKWVKPILETKDSAKFTYDYATDTGPLYNYYFKAPTRLINLGFVQQALQKALEQTFDHQVAIEKRLMPVYKLVEKSKDVQRVIHKPDTAFITKGNMLNGFTIRNTVQEVLITLIHYLPEAKEFPFIDETGIEDHIQIKITGLITDLESIRKDLHRHGLDLIKGEREMETIVIRDRH